MASIVKKPNGTRLVQFVGPDKKRRVVRLGKIGESEARTIAEHIAHLAECAKYPDRPINKQTDKFVGKLFSDASKHWLYDRMAAAGLVTPRDIPEERCKQGAFALNQVGVGRCSKSGKTPCFPAFFAPPR